MNQNMYLSCVETAREVCAYELTRYRYNPRDGEARSYFQSSEFERWFTCNPRTVRMMASKLPPGAIYDYVLSLPVRKYCSTCSEILNHERQQRRMR